MNSAKRAAENAAKAEANAKAKANAEAKIKANAEAAQKAAENAAAKAQAAKNQEERNQARAAANAAAAKARANANAAAKAQAAEAKARANADAAAKAAANAAKAVEEAKRAKNAEEARRAANKAAVAARETGLVLTRGMGLVQQAAKPVNLPAPVVMRNNPLAESNSENENAPSLSSGNIENSIIRKLGKTNFKQVNAASARTSSRLNKSEQLYLQRIWAQKMFNQNYKNLMQIKGSASGISIKTLLARMEGYIRLMGPNVNREPKMNSVKNILKYTLLMGKAKKAQNPNVKRAFAIANKGWQNKTAHTKNHEKLMNNLQTIYNKYYNANGKPRGSEMNIIRNGVTLKRKADGRQYRTTNNGPTNYSKRGNWYQNKNNPTRSYITPNKGLTFYEIMGNKGGKYTVNTGRKLGGNIF
jgi:hypothetical protein